MVMAEVPTPPKRKPSARMERRADTAPLIAGRALSILAPPCATAGADALHRLGKCEIGDKTMYDALKPFADALRDNDSAGMPLIPAWQAATSSPPNRPPTPPPSAPVSAAPDRSPNAVSAPSTDATSRALIVTTVGKVLAGSRSAHEVAGVNV